MITIKDRVMLRRVGGYAKNKCSFLPGIATVIDIFPAKVAISVKRVVNAYGPLRGADINARLKQPKIRYVVRRQDTGAVLVLPDYVVCAL